jgi:hypothetical protein
MGAGAYGSISKLACTDVETSASGSGMMLQGNQEATAAYGDICKAIEIANIQITPISIQAIIQAFQHIYSACASWPASSDTDNQTSHTLHATTPKRQTHHSMQQAISKLFMKHSTKQNSCVTAIESVSTNSLD